MIKILKSFFSLVLVIFVQTAFAQSVTEEAKKKGDIAVKLEDEGKFDEAIKLLNEARLLDPSSLIFQYELAYSYYSKKDYNKAIAYLEPLTSRKDVIDRVFQLLGNSYDDLGNSDKALQVYDEGLNTFPNSGKLYLEKGNVYWIKKLYNKALPFYEQGIKAEPAFPSNYYRAARIYCSSTEEMWGMIYGELFINLERNSDRTKEISKLLYDTYKQQILFKGDTTTVSFAKNNTINVSGLDKTGKLKLPFSLIYEPTLSFAVVSENVIDLNSLDRIRTKFLNFYYQKGFDTSYPNVLFEYQRKIENAGNLEAYNHWLLMMGDEKAFNSWKNTNLEKWNNFIKWFTDNRISLTVISRFYREQY